MRRVASSFPVFWLFIFFLIKKGNVLHASLRATSYFCSRGSPGGRVNARPCRADGQAGLIGDAGLTFSNTPPSAPAVPAKCSQFHVRSGDGHVTFYVADLQLGSTENLLKRSPRAGSGVIIGITLKDI